MSLNIAYLCCGLLALLLFVLSINVSHTRLKMQRGYGHDADATQWLTRAVRAQGNAAEYIPVFIILILILELEDAPDWLNWIFAVTVLVRYLHAVGMLLSKDLNQPHPLRFIGSLGTYVTGVTLSAILIYIAL